MWIQTDLTRQAEARAGDRRPAILLPFLCLFAGTFAVGTDGFMISGLVPEIARHFATSTAVAAQLTSVFAVTYALGAPLMSRLLARADRRLLLVLALGGLGAMNLLAALAPSLAVLFLARIAAALAACLYTPTASVVAANLASAEHRGRALSLVTSGLTVAIATGVPTGVLVGERFGWRATFAAVALLAALVSATLWTVLQGTVEAATTTMHPSGGALHTPAVFRVLGTTLLGILAGYLAYTYVASVSRAAGSSGGSGLAVVLAGFGAGAACGVLLSGAGVDRYGQPAVVRAGAVAQLIALLSLGALHSIRPHLGVSPVALAFTVLGAGSFAYAAPQQHRLIELSPENPTTLISLNSSAIYAGIGLSGVLGALTLQAGPTANCLTGALLAAATATIARKPRSCTRRHQRRRPGHAKKQTAKETTPC